MEQETINMNDVGKKPHVIKVGSVSEARRKFAQESNKYIKKYGEMLWSVALLTAYQGGGYDELQHNFNDVPMKYVELLLDAYRYKNTELEFLIAQAASRPHLKKNEGKKYMDNLANKLEGKA